VDNVEGTNNEDEGLNAAADPKMKHAAAATATAAVVQR
jgi:hypothetical protein